MHESSAAIGDRRPPVHVAIIMDGNGRWARARGLPRAAGHREGAKTVRRIVEAASDIGIRWLTLYGFSAENWKRPAGEIADLMGLLRRYLRSEIAELHRNNIRFRVIGRREDLSTDIVRLIETGEAETAGNTGMTLTMALSYGSRQELTEAVRSIAQRVADGTIDPARIDDDTVGAHLMTRGIPDPDLLIRTSGELRISNFLLWQLAYTELVFTEVLWPDFERSHLEDAVREFNRRDRRFGGAAVG
ncbi:MAG: isoprenyl transferase [Alphaproteobacteria bacterium]